jgi:phage tail sheath protein FI
MIENDDEQTVEEPVFLTRDDVNAYLGAYGIVGFRNTAQGWVVWGDNTAAFPGSTDVKDYMIPIRRMFNYVSNQFQVFADSRVDMPLNLRQLEGVVKSFNQILAGWVGFGALNAGSVELDKELNTTASLLAGTVYVRIRIAPPPAMVVIEGVLEYDVQGFERSLA